MKSNFKIFLFILAVAGLVWTGCQTKFAPVGAYGPTSADPALISNFDSGSLSVNPNLYEIGEPGNTVSAPGVFSFVNFLVLPVVASGSVVTAAPGANFSPMACHFTASINDAEGAGGVGTPGTFDSVQLRCQPETGGNPAYYNASFFTGIQFYLKLSSSDNVPTKQFTIPIDQTEPGPIGVCQTVSFPSLTHCFDDYAMDYSRSTRDQWVLWRINFSDMKQGGFGSPTNPATLSGVNLKHFIFLSWVEGNSAQAGPFTIDVWVDEVRFF